MEANFRPGDWLCACGAHNYASKSSCFKCHIPKLAADMTNILNQKPTFAQQGAYQNPSQNATLPNFMGYHTSNILKPNNVGFDLSALGHLDVASLSTMTGIDAASLQAMMYSMIAPTTPRPANFRPGDWMCPCGNHNYASRSSCVKCHVQKGIATGDLAFGGLGAPRLGGFGSPQFGALPANYRLGDWLCICGNHNYQSRVLCGKCKQPKNISDKSCQKPETDQASSFREGDWHCACGNHNYAKRSECNRCRASKPQSEAKSEAKAHQGLSGVRDRSPSPIVARVSSRSRSPKR